MAKNLTPAQVAEKHIRRTKQAVVDMQNGVAAVTEAPSKAAVAKQDKLLSNLTASIQSGKWARNTARVTLDDWKKAMLEKGVNRVAQGLDGSQKKIEDFFAQLLPFQQNIQQEISRMPDLTLEDGINRATAWMRKMATFKRS